MKNGEYIFRHKNGQIKLISHYLNGKFHGLRERWYPNGQLEFREYYFDGKLQGLREEWSEDGQLWKREDHVNGKNQGIQEVWHYPKAGHKKYRWMKGYFLANQRHGLSKEWYDPDIYHGIDQLKSKVNFAHCMEHGHAEYWHPDGEKSSKGNKVDGHRHGDWKIWIRGSTFRDSLNLGASRQNGQPKPMEYYIYGDQVGEGKYQKYRKDTWIVVNKIMQINDLAKLISTFL